MTKRWMIWVAIMTFAIMTRTWDLPNLMHFELDQARDAYVVYDALASGILPAEGPIARGSDLRLGPIFYYFQVFSGSLFGAHPLSAALPDILWGIGIIPLIHILARRFASRDVAYAVTALATTSLFLITYSRFGWNPNGMAFWSIVSVLLMLYAGETRHALIWRLCAIFGWGVSVGVLMQLHFIAFLTLPLIYGLYSLIQVRLTRTFWWRGIIVGICGFLIAFAPVLIHEVRSGGAMTQILIATINDKSAQDHAHTLLEKMIRAGQETSTYFTLFLVSEQWGGDSVHTRTDGGFHFMCDDNCQERFPFLLCEIILFVSAILLLAYRVLRNQIATAERPALYLIILWGLGAGLFLFLVAYQISPRFYLFLTPVFIALWSTLFAWLAASVHRAVFIIIVTLLCSFNMVMYITDLRTQRSSQYDLVTVPRDVVMERSDRVTYGALQAVGHDSQRMLNETNLDGVPHIIVGDNRYARALHYIITTQYPDMRVACYVKRSDYDPVIHGKYPTILLTRTRSKRQVPDERKSDIIYTATHGTLTYTLLRGTTSAVRDDEDHTVPAYCHQR